MSAMTPYVHLPGTAREALTFYADVFGGEAQAFTRGEMGAPGEPDSVGHGQLTGPVTLMASDANPGDRSLRTEGLMLALLGTAEPDVLREWFRRLADGGEVIDELQLRPWGDWDGQVRDRFGLHWLIGFQPED